MATKTDNYAIIALGGKQYRVREGERLLVDRVPHDEGKTFHPDLVMLGGDGDPKLGDALKGAQVTAKVSAHVLGEKVIVGKHRRRTGYRRRNGHRSRLSQIEIQSIGTRGRSTSSTPQAKGRRTTAAKKTTGATATKSSTTSKKDES
jgi:large subunit ribosomal protein L21